MRETNIIYECLNQYIQNPDPQYAVMLKGKWGCGKTYFIKNWLQQFNSESNDENAEAGNIILKPVYVTLYGISRIGEVSKAIDRELNPFFYSKTGKVLAGVAKIAGKVLLKTSFDFNGDNKEDASFSGSIDSLSLFRINDDTTVKGDKFIVFDDIERCQIDMKKLLGYINYFVEHCNCHVVVIGDETHLLNDSRDQLAEFKEKTIGKEYEIQPDIEAAINYFLNEVPDCDYLQSEHDFIIQCFQATSNGNLRLLRQCLQDFNAQIKDIDNETIENGRVYLHSLLDSFIAVYAELNNKANHEIIKDWRGAYMRALCSKNEDEKNSIKRIQEKYLNVSRDCIFAAFEVEAVEAIVRHITTGWAMQKFINKRVTNRTKELTCWEKLSGFWEMDNDVFESKCEEAMNVLLKAEIQQPYQVGTTIAYFGYFDALRIRYFTEAEIALAKKGIRQTINEIDDLQKLYEYRVGIVQGFNNFRPDVECPIINDAGEFVNNECITKSHTLPDLMQQELRKLSDENVEGLIVIDGMTYPNRSCSYQMRAIFEYEDPSKLFESIKNLSNRGRNSFCFFLTHHYSFDSICSNVGDQYKQDLNVLNPMHEMTLHMIDKTKRIERMTYKLLKDALRRSILRCEGNNKV